MGSWVRCMCGHNLHKNIACGANVSFVASEEILERERANLTPEQVVAMFILNSDTLLTCPKCKRLVIVRRNPESEVEFFERCK